jgi:hypothetical protein
MSPAAIVFSILRFAVWQACVLALAVRLARALGWRLPSVEGCLAALAIDVTLEASLAGALSFARMNSGPAYWAFAAAAAAAWLLGKRLPGLRWPAPGRWAERSWPFMAALLAPLALLSFRPVEEIDSINYLHYLIDWMANRATPYTFSTNYVAFWELSFLPAWVVTRVDLFFPLIALKGVALLGLGAWLVGRELGLRRELLLWTVFGCLAMRYCWFGYSGVPTLKNDALHGAGFVLLTLAVLRAARGLESAGRGWQAKAPARQRSEVRARWDRRFRLSTRAKLGAPRGAYTREAALLAFGAAFASVKYTGVFFAVVAVGAVVWLRRREILARRRRAVAAALALAGFVLSTSGHYYVRSLVLHGSPFFPFQINLGFIHLPGTADLSDTSILYSLRDARLWRAFLLPGGVMPAGAFFPAILAGGLVASAWFCARGALGSRAVRAPRERAVGPWVSFCILCGWLLYFRSAFSASATPGDLRFVLNGLNSLRYVEGVLAVTTLFLVSLLARRAPRLAMALVAVDAGSRLFMLYRELPPQIFPWGAVCLLALAAFLAARGAGRWGFRFQAAAVAVALVAAGPFVVERNRALWTTYWNDLKPTLAAARPQGLAVLALPGGSYFAGHVVAAGNPIHPAVGAFVPDAFDALPAWQRPTYLAVLATPGDSPGWSERYAGALERWGYTEAARGRYGVLFRKSGDIR